MPLLPTHKQCLHMCTMLASSRLHIMDHMAIVFRFGVLLDVLDEGRHYCRLVYLVTTICLLALKMLHGIVEMES